MQHTRNARFTGVISEDKAGRINCSVTLWVKVINREVILLVFRAKGSFIYSRTREIIGNWVLSGRVSYEGFHVVVGSLRTWTTEVPKGYLWQS